MVVPDTDRTREGRHVDVEQRYNYMHQISSNRLPSIVSFANSIARCWRSKCVSFADPWGLGDLGQ